MRKTRPERIRPLPMLLMETARVCLTWNKCSEQDTVLVVSPSILVIDLVSSHCVCGLQQLLQSPSDGRSNTLIHKECASSQRDPPRWLKH